MEHQNQTLRELDEQIFTIFNSTPSLPIQAFDEHGIVTFWNNASEELYGYRGIEVIGRPVNKRFFADDDAEFFMTVLKRIGLTDSLYGPVEWNLRCRDGSSKTVYSTLFKIRLSNGEKRYVCMDADITEQKRLSKELERLSRLHLVGEMAAGLAHEIRNPMTTVRGYLQMLRNKPCYTTHSKQFDLMIEELDCANNIITEYLSLAKNKSTKKEMLHLNEIIEILLPLLYAEANRESKVINWTPGRIPLLLLDHNEIRQLIINIIRNAMEAVDAGGNIQIGTTEEEENVVLTIWDNGKGIPTETIDKIGTPFFTTKENGTGLGLAVCFSIALRHDARISIDSKGSGTNVTIKFSKIK